MRSYFFIGVILFSCSPNRVLALNLPEYTKTYLMRDEALKISGVDVDLARESYNISNDRYQSQLSFGPTQQHREFSTGSGAIDYYERRSSFEGQYSQNLPTGTVLSLEGQRFYERTLDNIPQLVAQYELGISQSLYKNAFGSLTTKRLKVSEKEWDFFSLAQKNQMVRSCGQAISNYIKVYSEQEKLKVIEEVVLEAQKTLNVVRRAYKRKMIRKMDWLSAQSDLKDIEGRRVLQQQDYLSMLASFLRHQKPGEVQSFSQGEELENPKVWMGDIPKPEYRDIEASLQTRRDRKKSEWREQQVSLAQDQNRSDISFGVVVGQREGLITSISSLVDYEDRYVTFSLKLDLPVVNKTRTAEVKRSQYKFKKTKLEEILNLKTQKETFRTQREVVEKSSLLKGLSKDKVKLYYQQFKEATRLLKNGRLEHVNYARYRDFYLTEKVNLIQHQRTVWEGQLSLSMLSEKTFDFCKRFL